MADTAKGVYALATNGETRAQFGAGIGNWWNQLSSGNAVVTGETMALVGSFFIGGGSASIGKAGEATSLMSKLRGVSTVGAGKATSLLDNLSGKMSEFQAAVNSQGLRYSFANIGDTQTVLGAVSKTADDFPKTGVKMNFNEAGEVTNKVNQAKKALQDALDKGPKAEVKSGIDKETLFKNIEKTDPNVTPRPDPSTYLTPDYIKAHNQLFDNGGTAFTRDSNNINKFGQFGRDDGAFIFPKEYAQKMIDASDGNPRKLERLLGLDNGSLGDSPIRIDISPENMDDLRIPSGNEEGVASSPQWRPGGNTYPGGIPEAVINPVKPDKLSVLPAFGGK